MSVSPSIKTAQGTSLDSLQWSLTATRQSLCEPSPQWICFAHIPGIAPKHKTQSPIYADFQKDQRECGASRWPIVFFPRKSHVYTLARNKLTLLQSGFTTQAWYFERQEATFFLAAVYCTPARLDSQSFVRMP